MNIFKRAAARLLRRRGTHHNAWAGHFFDWFEGTYRVDGCTFEVPRDLTTPAFRARFFFGVYEQEEVALVQEHIHSEDVVLEVGGGLGVVSCVTNRQLSDPRRHVVVEANPQLLPWLERNRNRNEGTFNVAHGLLDPASDGTFYVHPLIVGGSATRTTAKKTQVPVLSYKQLEACAEAPFSAVILDIEGGEASFLQAHVDALEKVNTVIVEFHEHLGILSKDQAADCRARLRRAGLNQVEERNHTEVWKRPRARFAAPQARLS